MQRAITLHVLASGSKGNASIIECDGRAVLVDCGITKKAFFERCQELGVDPSIIEAVLITHEHTDHTKGIGVVTRGLAKEGIHPALYASNAVVGASRELQSIRDCNDMRDLHAGDALSLAGMQIHPFRTSHDAAESFGFRFEAEGDALGYMTDTGVVTGEGHDALRGVRLLALEANHDVQMLESGDYPYSLKVRVAGERGHLSNDQSARELQSLLDTQLESVIAMHISENNNTFGLPVRVLQALLDREGHAARVQAGLPRTSITVR